MLIAVVAKMRNGLLLRFRKERGLTQKVAAEQAGISATAWCAIEGMRFKDVSWSYVKTVANYLDVRAEEICPEVMRKTNLRLEATAFRECRANVLMAQDIENRMTLPSPADMEEEDEGRTLKHDAVHSILKTLTYREREIIKLRFGINEDGFTYTLEEIGRIFKCSRERVSQVEKKAIRKLQHPVRTRALRRSLGRDITESEKAVEEFFQRREHIVEVSQQEPAQCGR